MTSVSLSPTQNHSLPRSDPSLPQDESCESSTMTDIVHTTPAVPDTSSSQEQKNGETSEHTNEPVHASSPSNSTDENEEIIITAIRATDVALDFERQPPEFYIVLHRNGLEWRTENKRVSVNGEIEWTGPIRLSSDLSATIRVEVYATFQPALGTGEQLWSVTTTVEQLLGDGAIATDFRFFPEDGDVVSPCSSILATVKRQKCEGDGSSAPRVLGSQWSPPESRDKIKDETNRHRNASQQSEGQSSAKQGSTPGSTDEDPRVLSTWLLEQFERFGDLADLERAIPMLEGLAKSTSIGDDIYCMTLGDLGIALRYRFDRLGKLADIDDAILRHREAVDLTPRGDPEKAHHLNNLGKSHQTRFSRLGQLSDLEEAISNLREAVDLTPHGRPGKPRYLNSLGDCFRTRFGRLGQLSDLEDAISRQREAVDLTPHDHPDKPAHLRSLGGCYKARFDRFGQACDLDDAISRQREALNLTPHDHPVKPCRLNGLSDCFRTRFGRFGQLSDLEDAISSLREAIDLTPYNHPHKSHVLSRLGNCYRIRFERLEQLGDLEEAISSLREAVDLTPHDHPVKSCHLSSLGNCYRARFERLGQLSDLEDAILQQREAIDITPYDDPRKSVHLSNLGNCYQTRFKRLGQLGDLEGAISSMKEAVGLTPQCHPTKFCRLNGLSNCYRARFEHLGQLDDLEDAISGLREAISLTPHGHPHKPLSLSSLGDCYRIRFERLGQFSDLEDAISTLREAVDLTPHGHPKKPRHLNSLGNCYRVRFDRLGRLSDIERAISVYSYAASTPVGHIDVQLSAANAWISSARRVRHHTLLHAYSIAVSLIPRLAWIGHSLSHRYDELTRAADVVREAAAAALEEGFPETAVEWLEQGRSIIWGELFQLRSSDEELSSAHPDHACRLRELSAQLDLASAAHEQSLSRLSEQNQGVTHRMPETLQDRHRMLAIERDKLLQEIRRLPGFGNFLLRKHFSQLRASAHSGPVVILNVSKTRCDALIVIASLDHVIHVPLPGFTSKRSTDLQNTMKHFVRRERGTSRIAPLKGVNWKSILSPLWKTVVKPVLDALAFSVVPEEPSRIFWCPTGPLAFLPIHAAGLYHRRHSAPGHKVFDFVVSSYVPTLGVLTPSPNPTVPASNDIRILAVSQPSSDGQSPLPGVVIELARIKDIIENSPFAQATLVKSSVGTVEEVLALMKETDWVHFACHGVQDGVNSGLCLADRRRLDLRNIVALSRPRGGLAFLSACQTAMGEKRLSDEAIHMAAGMLFAGYGGVVATMWSISDALAPRVARDIYTQLFKKGAKPDYREAARALHDAMHRLRGSNVPFTEWIPFIHVGL